MSLALNGTAPYEYINVSNNFMASTSAVTGRSITWDEVNFIFSPQKTGPVAPTINGPVSQNLIEGYAASSTGVYTITGTAPVHVTIDNDYDGRITWDNVAKILTIAAGLPAGVYTVKITASNGTPPDAELTYTLTIDEDATANETVGASSLKAYAQNGVLYINGLPAGKSFFFNDTAAAQIYTGSKTEILLPARGIYLVTDGATTVKALY
jgi:hypothetical protein